MSHSQTVSAGEDMVMEQNESPITNVDVILVAHQSETQIRRQTDGTQNSNSDESENMVMEQNESRVNVIMVAHHSESQAAPRTDGTQNSDSDESDGTQNSDSDVSDRTQNYGTQNSDSDESENMVMEQSESGVNFIMVAHHSESYAAPRTDGTQNSNSDESERQKRFEYLKSCVCLYQAAFKGNWQEAKDLLGRYPDLVRDPITEKEDTALHIAAAANHPNFVKELLKLMRNEDLEITNRYGQTALYLAAASGNVIIAEEMMKKNGDLTLIRRESQKIIRGESQIIKFTPLYIAALLGRREMVSFLFDKTPFGDLSCGDHGERIELLVATISNDLYDIALRIMQKDAQLAIAKDINGKTALYELARKPFGIGSKSELSVSKRCLNSCFKEIYNKALMQTLARKLAEDLWREVRQLPERQFCNHVKTFLFEAAKMGNAELLIIVIRSYPDLIWTTDEKFPSIFHIAVLNRQETVFNLIFEIGAIKDTILIKTDSEDQNILHLAGKLAPTSRLNMVSGAALQMQRELLWFKEVQKMVPPSYAQMKSKARGAIKGKKPWDLFTDAHNDLKIRGETWMKDTANYCMVVATLIATVVFAAAFTVPGGNKGDTGIPVFLKSKWFRVFFISDAVALLCSSTSILMFLSILTSRFTEEDFLHALPGKLVVGLTALFMSIGGMVAAFSATCFLVYESEISWLPIVIIASAGFPVALFVLLHRQLWVDAIHSYWSGLLLGPRKRRFFFFGRKRRLF